jgi:hypothetical protein
MRWYGARADKFGAHAGFACVAEHGFIARKPATIFEEAVIVDVLGKAGFPRSVRALTRGGRYLLVGFSGGLVRIARALATGGPSTSGDGRASSPAWPIRSRPISCSCRS